MSLFIQYVASGIATGCTFALVATGFVAIYRVTRVVNFAQGIFAIVGGMMTYSLLGHGVPHFAAEALAVVSAGVTGLVVGGIAIGRRGTPPLASLIITLGLAVASYAVLVLAFGDSPVSYDGVKGSLSMGAVQMQWQYVLIVGVTAASFGLLALFFGRTYLGRALTACSSNPNAARLVGINITRMGLVSFTLGGALGGLAGVLLTPVQPVAFNSDVNIAINGFAAAVFGGVSRPGAALVGALVLGVAEALVAGYSNAAFESGVALLLMLALMVWQASRRPTMLEDAA